MHLSKRIHRDVLVPAIEPRHGRFGIWADRKPPPLSLSRGRVQSELWGHPYRLATAVVR
jgi:hypothetical protein